MRLKSIGVLITNGFQNLLCVFVNIILNVCSKVGIFP